MKTALVTIATGESYRQYAKQMIYSAGLHWMLSELTFVVFTDEPSFFYGMEDTYVCYTTPKQYPNETLFRYETMLGQEKTFAQFDNIYYCDADMMFVAPVGDEVFRPDPGIVAVRHPGYMVNNVKGDCEKRSASQAFCIDNRAYYAGGFQGGPTTWYIDAMLCMRETIRADFENNITAKWHDESHWNRFVSDAEWLLPGWVKELTPSYCYPEDYDGGYGWKPEEYPPILVCLDKKKRGNHPRFK